MQTPKPYGIDSIPSLLSFESIYTQFLQHFKLVVATTPKLREEVYKIRYKVYCQELKYEPEENYPNKMEQDIYDQRSIHCLLMHRRSGLHAGCVRLVLPDPHGVEANLPYKRVCGQNPQHSITGLKSSPHGSCGEVSRLAVTADFRKRDKSAEESTLCQTFTRQNKFVESERQHFPLIAIGLYLASTSVVQELNLDGALTLMEPRLARHLRRFGLNCHQIGEMVEFHGQRALFHMSLEEVLSTMNISTWGLFQMIRLEVKNSLLAYNQHPIRPQAA